MKPLSRKDYPLLKGLFERQPHRLSTYSLPSIIAWNGDCFESHYEIVHGEVIIVTRKITDNDDKGYLIMPVGGNGRPAPAALKELVVAMGCERLSFVPGDYLQEVGESAVLPYFDIPTQSALPTLVNYDSTVTTTPKSTAFFNGMLAELKRQLGT